MDNSPSTHSVEDLAKALKKARENGQQVVPIVGAGLSADCGFPIIAAVVRYLGRLYHYIGLRGPVYDYSDQEDLAMDIFKEHFDRYKLRPWKFLEDFGWPDWFQLNEDLFWKFEVKARKGKRFKKPVSDEIESAEREELDTLLRRFNPQGVQRYSELLTDTKETLDVLKKRRLFKGPKRNSVVEQMQKRIDSRFQVNWSNSAQFDVIGDWSRLILYFTNYHSEYADALFAKFGATRKPGQGHRFLAFLSKSLAVRTIITFNFDSLIEEALEIEGIRCKVFAMERGSGLPYQDLVRDHLSVIKAHGSTHALLLDEQLDRPLSPEYLDRFDRIVGDNPILLVMGCSAGDRRLRDLVSHVVRRFKPDKTSGPDQPPSVAWLHYEQFPPSFIENDEKIKSRTLALRTNNPGATLLHLYSWLTSSNPASRVPYLAHVQQPIELAAVPGSNHNKLSSRSQKGQFDWIAVTGSKFLTASQLLFKRANSWAQRGYQFIWIDLESLHTFAGVVGSIIDQCRKVDPDLVPSLLPAEIDKIGGDVSSDGASLDKVINLAAQRVARALRRARYYLAIDGLGSYPWPATAHHGLTHMAITRGAQDRLENMVKFLQFLEKEDLGGSRVGVGLDQLTSRYKGLDLPKSAKFKSLFYRARRQGNEPKSNRQFRFEDYFRPVRSDLPVYTLTLKKIPAKLKKVLATGPKQDTDALIAMVFFSLSCFRRTRPLVATTYLLEPLLGQKLSRDKLQETLSPFIKQSDSKDRIWILQQLEGGSYWFNHSIRDQIYARNTEYAGTRSMQQCLDLKAGARVNSEHRRKTVFQLFLSAITHQRISQIWYNQTFVQSRDTFAFLEYTYHRISSIRNLVKLRALARVGAGDEVRTGNKIIAEDLVRGIYRCTELIRLLNEDEPPFKELLFGESGPFANSLRKEPKEDFHGDDWFAQAREIEKSLQSRHRRQLHGLYRGWTRAEHTLRTQVPAEQLLHWCDELLRDDLINRCNRLVIDYRETSESNFEPVFYKFRDSNPGELIDPELDEDEGDLKEFRRFLQDLQVQLWIERSDYLTCISHRRKHLWHSLGEEKRKQLKLKDSNLKGIPVDRSITTEIEVSAELIKQCRIRQCHQLLNIANCKLKSQQEITADEEGLKVGTKGTLELLQAIKRRLRKLKPKTRGGHSSSNTNDYHEAWLRMLHLEAETRIRHVSMFSHDGFTGDPQEWKLTAGEVKEAERVITQGLEEVGGRDVHTRAAPRSVILHPTADAALYLQYRSVFHMFKGRTDWLADPENKANGLKEALRSFEMARGGLDNDGPLISALIEIYVAEAVIARARVILFSNDASQKSFGEAQQMYDVARGALRRAQESLLVSHHHLMWRKLFLRIRTQYYSDRLLLRYAKLQKRVFEEKTSGFDKIYKDARERKKFYEEHGREALLRLRRAYQTLVSALDLYLPHSAKNDPSNLKRFRWLYRMWWELTLCGYAIGRVVNEALEPDISPKAHEYVILQMEWVNTADGVNDSALKRVFTKNRRRIKTNYDESLRGTESNEPWQTALNRRRNLILLANELSAKQISKR